MSTGGLEQGAGSPCICIESIFPNPARDPDTGDAWLSFGGGHIYTVRLAADLWLEPGQDWFPESWPPSGFNHVANGPEPNGEEQLVEAPFLHPIMVPICTEIG